VRDLVKGKTINLSLSKQNQHFSLLKLFKLLFQERTLSDKNKTIPLTPLQKRGKYGSYLSNARGRFWQIRLQVPPLKGRAVAF